MELRLHTKNKTYTADTLDVSFGVIEDIIDVLEFDSLDDIRQVGVAVLKCSKQLKPFLKEVFEGVTDEELRTVKSSNIVQIFKDIYVYITQELGSVAKAAKN